MNKNYNHDYSSYATYDKAKYDINKNINELNIEGSEFKPPVIDNNNVDVNTYDKEYVGNYHKNKNYAGEFNKYTNEKLPITNISKEEVVKDRTHQRGYAKDENLYYDDVNTIGSTDDYKKDIIFDSQGREIERNKINRSNPYLESAINNNKDISSINNFNDAYNMIYKDNKNTGYNSLNYNENNNIQNENKNITTSTNNDNYNYKITTSNYDNNNLIINDTNLSTNNVNEIEKSSDIKTKGINIDDKKIKEKHNERLLNYQKEEELRKERDNSRGLFKKLTRKSRSKSPRNNNFVYDENTFKNMTTNEYNDKFHRKDMNHNIVTEPIIETSESPNKSNHINNSNIQHKQINTVNNKHITHNAQHKTLNKKYEKEMKKVSNNKLTRKGSNYSGTSSRSLSNEKKLNKTERFVYNRQKAKQMLMSNGNSICADCGSKDVNWVNIIFAVFLCPTCAKNHKQEFPKAHDRIKSLEVNDFKTKDVDMLKAGGNDFFNSYIGQFGVIGRTANVPQKYLYNGVLYHIRYLLAMSKNKEFNEKKPSKEEFLKPITSSDAVKALGFMNKLKTVFKINNKEVKIANEKLCSDIVNDNVVNNYNKINNHNNVILNKEKNIKYTQ